MVSMWVGENGVKEMIIYSSHPSFSRFSDCSKTKATLQGLNVPNVGILELDKEAEGSDIQAYLKDKTGQSSVPNVFINGKHIGGNSDLQELNSKGELQKLIAA